MKSKSIIRFITVALLSCCIYQTIKPLFIVNDFQTSNIAITADQQVIFDGILEYGDIADITLPKSVNSLKIEGFVPETYSRHAFKEPLYVNHTITNKDTIYIRHDQKDYSKRTPYLSVNQNLTHLQWDSSISGLNSSSPAWVHYAYPSSSKLMSPIDQLNLVLTNDSPYFTYDNEADTYDYENRKWKETYLEENKPVTIAIKPAIVNFPYRGIRIFGRINITYHDDEWGRGDSTILYEKRVNSVSDNTIKTATVQLPSGDVL